MNKTNKNLHKDADKTAISQTPCKQNTVNTTSIIIKLPEELTIAQVESFKVDVIDLIENHNELSLDDSEIVRIDTTGTQLIIAIVNHISSLKKTFNWQCSANCIQESIKQLGINETILNQYLVT
jgi:anti-anti-sigma regulatory factor